MKLVMDSSSLISISSTCLIELLEGLKKEGMRFIIPVGVERETVLRPLNIKRFELNAIRIKKAISEGWVEVFNLGQDAKKITQELETLANHSFYHHGKPIKLIHAGEAESLALAKVLDAGILVVDERTTRTLLENPFHIKNIMERRYKIKIKTNRKNINEFKEYFPKLDVVRSTELIALAHEKGLLQEELTASKNSIEAALYALKYSGCAISSLEIEKFLKGI